MDAELQLFQSADGRWTTAGELAEKLRVVVGDDCQRLFVQTDIMFGMPNRQLDRKSVV